MKPLAVASLAALLLVRAADADAADARVTADARAALEKSTAFMRSIAAEGGYLWRYSEDLKVRRGEVAATATQVWIQPPGTPSMGQAFLRAYEVTQDRRFLEAARGCADALARGQLDSGGWDYSIDFDPAAFAKAHRRGGKAGGFNVSTFDDNTTQSAISFLMAFGDASKGSPDPRDANIRAATEYALQAMLRLQYPNGAWPQRSDGKPRNAADFPVKKATIPTNWPRTWPKEKYNSHYTFNDNAMRDCILLMLDAGHRYGKREYLEAAKRGGDFILLAQLPEPQASWAQQYNANMEPAWARAFEPPAVCTSESASLVRLLCDLYIEFGDAKYLKPIPGAIAWFNRSKIGDNLWARYYELGSNKPIYGDRDGKIYYRLEEISEERRTHYGWQGAFGIPGTIAYYESVKGQTREALLAKRQPKPPSDKSRAGRAQSLEPRVKQIVAALDAKGRWLNSGQIETETFIKNTEVLCNYLEAAK